jgi:hypothetical protein
MYFYVFSLVIEVKYCFIDHSVIQSAVEQAKMKFFILGKEKLGKLCNDAKEKENRELVSESIHRSCDELKTLSSGKNKFKSQGCVYDSVSIVFCR